MATKKKTMLYTAATAIIFMVCLLMPAMCLAQSDAWTWMSGSDQIYEAGIYGTKGVADAANVPGARYDSCSWTDAFGDLWLFGGVGLDGAGSYGWLNDLWRYDSGTGEWTWMSGANVVGQLGSYVFFRVADVANVPGARRGAVTWIDDNGDLWLFGGEGLDSSGSVEACHCKLGDLNGWLNDMWRYDTATNQWSWEDGSASMNDISEKGYYNDKGYPQPYVKPGAREGAIAWTDSHGFMWMFGGYGWQHLEYFETGDDDVWCWNKDKPCEECPNPGMLNDLWAYNRLTHEWAWVSGSDYVDELGDYGTRGKATFDNMPGGRMGAISWIDEDNNLWLFGGIGKDVNVPDYFVRRMNDMWRYDPDSKMWTWLSGSTIGDQVGIYVIDENTCPDAYIVPGCREEAVSWIDEDDNLWLYGGFGQAGTYSPIGGLLNDLWTFDNATKQWIWVSGSDEISDPNSTIVAGVYGTKGVADKNNVTGARQGAVPWIDSLGELWLFGGKGFDGDGAYGSMNDLWRFGNLPCTNDSECDDGLFCNGDETCVVGLCERGTAPCGGDTPFCDEAEEICMECLGDSNCDDGLFCNGDETCVGNVCVDGIEPCSGDTPVCEETEDVCLTCLIDGDCDDDLFCTGDETCVDGECVDGLEPCTGDEICDDTLDLCVECYTAGDCDDGFFCTGDETCVDNICVDGIEPCTGDEICDDTLDLCIECYTAGDCDDGFFCTGDETCVDNSCVDGAEPCFGDTPVCSEAGDVCLSLSGCFDDSDCDDAYMCQNNTCVLKCRLLIKHKKLSAAKLLKKNKDKKVTFKITTGDFGKVDMGPDIEVLLVKPNTKKGKVKVKALVPADIGAQIIPVWVGDCYGEIEILD